MCHYPMHKPYGGHTLFNAVEMTTLLNQFPNVVMWGNGLISDQVDKGHTQNRKASSHHLNAQRHAKRG